MNIGPDLAPSGGEQLAATLRAALDVLEVGSGVVAEPDRGAASRLRGRARDYGLAFFALADALAVERPSSTGTRPSGALLDLMRVDAFLVASKCHRLSGCLAADGRLACGPHGGDCTATLLLVDHLIAEVDRRLAARWLPLRATAYARVRDQLREVIDPLIQAIPRERRRDPVVRSSRDPVTSPQPPPHRRA